MKITSNYLIFLIGILSAMPVVNHANETINTKKTPLSATSIDSTQVALMPINAQFETIECAEPCKKPRLSAWQMWRNPNQVELRKVNAQTSELWLWENGFASYHFLMHDEKKAIEYSSVDLKMLNIAADSTKWQKLSNLVLQKDLASMKKTSLIKQFKGLTLSQYDGNIEKIKAQIVWIESLQLPLQITYFYPKHKTTVNLVNINSSALLAMATSEKNLNSYERIDFADIGDMEHSTTAKKWLSKAHDAPGIHTAH